MKKTILACSWLSLVAACGGDGPADVAGVYTISVTNQDNGCDLESWNVGEMTSGIPVTITQSGADFSAEVEGAVGGALELFLGNNAFTGDVHRSQLEATLVGRAGAQGSCAYTNNADLRAVVSGDFIEGTITWYFDTNSSAECQELATCSNLQRFNGTRPPR